MQQNEKLQTLGIEDIKTKIYEFRGLKVMLDKDLAELYHIETKQLNRQVKRNIERFPNDFMFQLTNEENKILRCQFGTSKSNHGGNRYLPYAFTELGIAMLSSVLQSPIAIQTNIFIMRTFVMLKNNISELQQTNSKIEQLRLEIHSYIEDILHDQNDINEDTATQLELINKTIAELQNEKVNREKFNKRKPIGFKIEK